MTIVAVSGATGYLGRFIVKNLLASGHEVIALGRNAPQKEDFQGNVAFRYFSLDDDAVPYDLFSGVDAFVHAAFNHEPGKYRGGEGKDRDGFIKRNVDGTNRLFKSAKEAGVKRVVFLSSRAVYGTQAPGTTLTEDMALKPDTLYGQIKLETEEALDALSSDDFLPISLRATGVYGAPSKLYEHKWSALFQQYENGETIDARIGTEVHGDDLAAAVDRMLHLDVQKLRSEQSSKTAIFNVSDILLDRHELIKAYGALCGKSDHPLPQKSDRSAYNQMDCSRLFNLGWHPRGKLDLAGLVKNHTN